MQFKLLFLLIVVCYVMPTGTTQISSMSPPRRVFKPSCILCANNPSPENVQHPSCSNQWLPKAMPVSPLYRTSNLSSMLKWQHSYGFRGSSTVKGVLEQRADIQSTNDFIAKTVHLSIRGIEKGKSTSSTDRDKSRADSSIAKKGRTSSPKTEHEAQTPTMRKTASTGESSSQHMTGAQSSRQKSQSFSGGMAYSKPVSLKVAEDVARKARNNYHETKSEYDTRWKAHSDAHLSRPLDLAGRQHILQDAGEVIAAKRAQMDILMQARTASVAERKPDRVARNNVKALSALLTTGALKAQYQFNKDQIAKETAFDLLTHVNKKYGPLHQRTATMRREHELSVIDAGASYQSKLARVSAARSVRNAGGRDTDSSDSDTSSNKSL